MRQIKRYGGGSRKLYDTVDSRYISLDDIASWISRGERLQVVDSRSGADVTVQTLTQVIAEGHKRGVPFFSAEFLHEVIRRGEAAVASGVEQLSQGVSQLAQVWGGAPAQLTRFRKGLAQLQRSLTTVEHPRPRQKRVRGTSGRPRARIAKKRA
jgi:polyhydroxyalkanoate synthesis repressor PhaR